MSELAYRTLRESMVDAIRNKILNYEIKPGERIVESELAHEFQTSRGPVREALRQLENEGILTYTRNVGCSVQTFSFWDSYEVYLLRTNYELVSVRLMRGQIPDETLKSLEETLEQMRILTVEQFRTVFDLDNNFHEALVWMPKMERLHKAWKDQYYSNLLAGYDLDPEKEIIVKRQYESHYKIYEACLERDCEKICERIREHYGRTIDRMMQEQQIDNPELIDAWRQAL